MQKILIGLLIWLVTVLTFTSANNNSTFLPCTPPIPSTQLSSSQIGSQLNSTLEELGNQIKSLFLESGVMGLYVTVVYDQDIIFQRGFGCGKNCVNTSKIPEPPSSTDIFRVGSITKIFTNMVLFQLRDAGLISKDTLLSEILPDLNMPNPFSKNMRGITLEMLGSHTAGVQAWAPCHTPCNFSTSEMIELLNQVPVIFPPLSYVHYSNLGIALLGRALETLLSVSYESFVQQEIFDVLQMNQAGFDEPSRDAMAEGFHVVGNISIPAGPLPILGWQAPAGQMYASPEDMSKFIKFLFRDKPAGEEQPLDGSTVREWMNTIMFQNNNPRRPTSFGLPWENLILLDKYLVRSKNGAISGYGTELFISPERKLGVITNVNQQPTFGVEILVAQLVMEQLLPLFESFDVQNGLSQLPPPNYQNLLGSYGFNSVRIMHNGFSKNRKLTLYPDSCVHNRF